MPFTGQLGTSNSYLGNIELGTIAVSGTNYNVTLTIDGNSAISQIGNLSFIQSLSINGNSATTVAVSNGISKSISIDGNSAVSESSAIGISKSISIDGNSAISESFVLTVFPSISIDGIADISKSNILNALGSLTIAGFSDCVGNLLTQVVLTIAGFSAITPLGGQVLVNTFSFDAIADISSLPGTGYEASFSIDGNSAFDTSSIITKDCAFSIDGVAAIAITNNLATTKTLTIAGTSAITISPLMNYVLAVNIHGISECFIGVAAILVILIIPGFSSIAIQTDRNTNESEPVNATSGFNSSCTGIFNRTVAQTFTIVQSSLLKRPTGIVQSLATLTQTIIVKKFVSKIVTQTLSLTQDPEASRGPTQTLVFSQTISVGRIKILSVAQTLHLVQTASRNTIKNESITHTLTFNIPKRKKAGIYGVHRHNPPVQFEYDIPSASIAIVPKKCLVILAVPERTIVLPCPQLGDTQSFSGNVNIKRTMTGRTLSYIRQSDLNKLKYLFWLGTYKAIELRDFLINYSDEIITLHNWKGETWMVNLINNPFDTTASSRWQPKGERHDITLEFEGVKIA